MCEIVEEVLYNPYNSKNKVITEKVITSFLSQYNVHSKINDIELFQRAFIHRSYVGPQKIVKILSYLQNHLIALISKVTRMKDLNFLVMVYSKI